MGALGAVGGGEGITIYAIFCFVFPLKRTTPSSLCSINIFTFLFISFFSVFFFFISVFSICVFWGLPLGPSTPQPLSPSANNHNNHGKRPVSQPKKQVDRKEFLGRMPQPQSQFQFQPPSFWIFRMPNESENIRQEVPTTGWSLSPSWNKNWI